MNKLLTLTAASVALSCAPNAQEIKKDKVPTADTAEQTAQTVQRFEIIRDTEQQALDSLAENLAEKGEKLEKPACGYVKDGNKDLRDEGDVRMKAMDSRLKQVLQLQNLTMVAQRGIGDHWTMGYIILARNERGELEVYKTSGMKRPVRGASLSGDFVCLQAEPMTLEKMEGWGKKEFENFVRDRRPVGVVSKVELVETHDVRAEHKGIKTECKDGECVTTHTGGTVEIHESSIKPVEAPVDGPVPDKLPSKEELTQWSEAQLKIRHHNASILLQRLAGKKSTLGHLPEYAKQIKFYEDLINLISDELGRREIRYGVGTAVPDSLPSKADLATWPGPNLLITRSSALALLQRLKAKPELQRLPEYSKQVEFYEDFIALLKAEINRREIQGY